jgi:hypothetical protein
MTTKEEEVDYDSTTIISNDFSNESQTTDYTSIEGLRTKLGIDNDQFFGNFIVKELMDNALDFIEQNAKKFVELKQKNKQEDQNPYVNVTIREQEINDDGNNNNNNKKKVTKIIVRNSNIVDNDVFPKNVIENIFKLENFHSSKRHQHIIKRGALGDGLKEILCIPYAFAIENNDDSWNYPLIFNISNKRFFEVRINNLSQVRKNLESPSVTIIPKEPTIDEKKDEEDETNNKFTEIVVYLPNIAVDYAKIDFLLRKYVVLNTHIDFHFDLPLDKPNHYYRPNYKATQNIIDWSNYQSVYYYSLSDFEKLIYSLQDRSNSNIANYVQKHFREGTNIKKDELLNILLNSKDNNNTILDMNINNNKNLERVYKRLKQQLPSKRHQSDNNNKLQVPFDFKTRENALKQRLAKIYLIEEDSFVYKKINGYYHDESDNNNNEIEFPYTLEIIIANVPYYHKKLYFYSSINFSPTLRYNPFQNQSNEEDIFSWTDKKNKKGDSQTKAGSSFIDILQDCGYSHNIQKHNKSKPNLVMINLISPRVDYTGRNKSYIKLDRFVSMAQDVYNFCRSVSIKNKNGSKEGSNVIEELRILLQERLHAVENNPKLKEIGRWTQSTVFYHLRPRLIQKGMNVNRDYITKQIRPVCNQYFGKKRHELGIIASERAQLYSKGDSLGVGFDQLENLMEKGTDLLVIEKEGVADVLAPFAKQKGIAILNTRGFLTEYATDLSELAESKGCNIVTLTDLDSSGLLISTSLPDAYRIGIDFKTLAKLDLFPEDVEEDIVHKKDSKNDNQKGSKGDNHIESLKNGDHEIPFHYSKTEWNEMVSYIDKGKRIEIDSVLKAVGNEKFWNFILDELDDTFLYRNYNRSIDVPEYVSPKEIDDLLAKIKNIVMNVQAEERENVKKELKRTTGFLDVDPKEKEIKERLRTVVENNPDVKDKILDEIKNFSFEDNNKKSHY